MRLGAIYTTILPSFLGKLGFVLGLQFSLVLFAGHCLFQGFDAEGCIHGLGQPSRLQLVMVFVHDGSNYINFMYKF